MTRLVRKVTIAKWKNAEWASVDRVPADAISIDLRTGSNTLSFWRADTPDPEAESKAILALLGSLDRIDKIDLVFVDTQELGQAKFEETLGNTVFEDLRPLHIDLANLDQHGLMAAVAAVGNQVYKDKVTRLTRKEVRTRLQNALDAGKLSWDQLPNGFQSELTKPQ